MITITLTKDQAEKLSDLLWFIQDRGPTGQGWASDELSALRVLIDKAIEADQTSDEKAQA
jgi:hypothetical protein